MAQLKTMEQESTVLLSRLSFMPHIYTMFLREQGNETGEAPESTTSQQVSLRGNARFSRLRIKASMCRTCD